MRRCTIGTSRAAERPIISEYRIHVVAMSLLQAVGPTLLPVRLALLPPHRADFSCSVCRPSRSFQWLFSSGHPPTLPGTSRVKSASISTIASFSRRFQPIHGAWRKRSFRFEYTIYNRAVYKPCVLLDWLRKLH